ncbi:MAG: helix-turn-helix transcriptional regulator [Ruminiclostridium sp.]|nr:helix-turn-helix transcriptional regulator [Ruminiclostridium sp.]
MDKNKIIERFKRILKDLRTEKGLSQDEFAKVLGISKGAVSYYETGQRVPDIVVLSAIADYFKVSTDYLLGRTEIKSVDEDVQVACKVTGLSERTINSLQEMRVAFLIDNGGLSETLDKMISSLAFKGLIIQSLQLANESEKLKNGITLLSVMHASYALGINQIILIDYIKETFGEDIINDSCKHDDSANLARYNSTKYLEKILDIFDFRSRTDFDKLSKEEWLSLLKIDDSKFKELQERSEEYEACFEKAGD